MKQSSNLLDCNAYKKSKAEAQRVIKDSGKQHWRNTCNNITSSTKLSSVWKMVKNMQGIRSTHSAPTIKHGGSIIVTNQEKAEAFAENFARNSSDLNLEKELLARRDKKVLNTDTDPESMSDLVNDLFAFHELQSAIKQCKRNSSPGWHRIRDDPKIASIMSKDHPPSVQQHLGNWSDTINMETFHHPPNCQARKAIHSA